MLSLLEDRKSDLSFNPFTAIEDNSCLLYHLLMYFGSLYCKKMNPDQTADQGSYPDQGS